MSTDDQQKRGGLVPIGKVGVRLPGIEGRGRAMSARARQHFTLLKQVNQLIEAAEGEPEIGFMARLLALCSLPRTNPRDRLQHVRRNGPYTLGISAGINNKLPYGNIPRLLLAWVCSEAVRTQSRDLVLGRSLYEFMHKLGMEDRSGGRHQLGERFFQEIIAHPIPLGLHTLRALKRSPLGLDLYFWLTYRTFTLKTPLTLSWRQLYKQFGAHPADGPARITGFRWQCLRELKKIKRTWPDLNYHPVIGGLVIEPSPPRSSRHNSGSSPNRP